MFIEIICMFPYITCKKRSQPGSERVAGIAFLGDVKGPVGLFDQRTIDSAFPRFDSARSGT